MYSQNWYSHAGDEASSSECFTRASIIWTSLFSIIFKFSNSDSEISFTNLSLHSGSQMTDDANENSLRHLAVVEKYMLLLSPGLPVGFSESVPTFPVARGRTGQP